MKNILLPIVAAFVLSSSLAQAADAPQGGGARGACKADVDKLCSGMQPGGGRIVGCLKQNEAKVSAPCKDAMAMARAKRAPGGTAPQGS
jgi:Cysteine rich repeat